MKWIKNDVSFTRGNHRPCIVKFDNTIKWLVPSSSMTTNTFKSVVKALGEHFGAKIAEVKYMYDDDGKKTEADENMVGFVNFSSDKYKFRIRHWIKQADDTYTAEDTVFQPEEIFNVA